jgi:hypothetical protein
LHRVGEQIRDKALEGDGATVGHGRRQLGGELGVGHQPGPGEDPAGHEVHAHLLDPPSFEDLRAQCVELPGLVDDQAGQLPHPSPGGGALFAALGGDQFGE